MSSEGDVARLNNYIFNFALTPEQIEKLRRWLKPKKAMKQGAIGGELTFCFTPTSLGTVTEVQRADGSKIDLTDYGSW